MTKSDEVDNTSGSPGLEEFKKLDNMSPDELKGWIRQFLETGDPSPINLWEHYGLPYEILLDLIEDILPPAFSMLNEKMKGQIAALVVSPLPRDEYEGSVLWDIMTMASRLRVDSAQKALIDWVKEGNLRGKLGRNIDLHYCAIDALAHIGMKESELFLLIERDFEDYRYIDVIYRAICTVRPELAADYFPKVMVLIKSKKDSRVIAMSLLRRLIEKFDVIGFVKYFSEPIIKLEKQVDVDFVFDVLQTLYPERERDLFTAIMQKVKESGYHIRFRNTQTHSNETRQIAQIASEGVFANSINPILIELETKSVMAPVLTVKPIKAEGDAAKETEGVISKNVVNQINEIFNHMDEQYDDAIKMLVEVGSYE